MTKQSTTHLSTSRALGVLAAGSLLAATAQSDVVFGAGTLRIATSDSADFVDLVVGPSPGEVTVIGAGDGSGTYFSSATSPC